jgi:hypothetical protein
VRTGARGKGTSITGLAVHSSASSICSPCFFPTREPIWNSGEDLLTVPVHAVVCCTCPQNEKKNWKANDVNMTKEIGGQVKKKSK